MIHSGELKDKIKFERATNTTAANGDNETVFVEVLNTFAKVVEKSGCYNYESGKVNSQSRIEIHIRYRPVIPVIVGDRVTWRGFIWILENSPVVDTMRTSIKMTATLQVDSSYRGEGPPDTENNYVVDDYVTNYFE
jgi:head-tail adaptor